MYYFYYSKKRLIFWDDHEVVSASCDNDVACVFGLSILECPSVFSNVCLSRLVRPMLPVSLDCQVVIAHSVFSNVYLSCVLCAQCCQCIWIVKSWLPIQFSLMFICPVCCVSNVASVSGLSIIFFQFSLMFICPVCCVSNVASVSGLSIIFFRFSLMFICPVCCVSNVASVSRFSIIDCLYGFL